MPDTARRPNIVLIHGHDLGAWLPMYGMPSVPSPHLQELAGQGVVFASAFSAAPLCTPARGSLFTGMLPHQNGLIGLTHDGFAYRGGVRTLPEHLREHGYRSALVGLQHEDLDPRVLGFDEVHGLGFLPRALEVAQRTEWWLEREPTSDVPFFLSVGMWEAHRPWPVEDYEPADPDVVDVPPYLPDNADTRRDIAQFHGAIRQLDEAVGRVLDAVDRSPFADDTLVVFTTDHGAAFPRAKSTLYDSGVQVAFIVRPPRSWDVPPGRRDELVSHLDLVPTLVELAGGQAGPELQGRSFLGLLRGETSGDGDRELVLEKTYHDRYDPIRALRTREAKYIRNFAPGPQVPLALDLQESDTMRGMPEDLLPDKPAEELYLLDEDPWELRNVADDPRTAELRRAMSERLLARMAETRDPVLDGPVAHPPAPSRGATV